MTKVIEMKLVDLVVEMKNKLEKIENKVEVGFERQGNVDKSDKVAEMLLKFGVVVIIVVGVVVILASK